MKYFLDNVKINYNKKMDNYLFEKYRNRLLNSFPKKLNGDVNEIIKILPLDNCKIKNNLFSEDNIVINLTDEKIHIPYRIYFNEIKYNVRITDIQKAILFCIYSRHHDGFIRQKYIEKIVDSNYYWITPFFIQLFGEYIYEIIPLFDEYYKNNINNCIKFINENKEYWGKIECRVISYWNEYYRHVYPEYKKYIGNEIICKINKNI